MGRTGASPFGQNTSQQSPAGRQAGRTAARRSYKDACVPSAGAPCQPGFNAPSSAAGASPACRHSTTAPLPMSPAGTPPGSAPACNCSSSSGQGWPGGGSARQAGRTTRRGSGAAAAFGAAPPPAAHATCPCHCSSTGLRAAAPRAAGVRRARRKAAAVTAAAAAAACGVRAMSSVRWVQPGLEAQGSGRGRTSAGSQQEAGRKPAGS